MHWIPCLLVAAMLALPGCIGDDVSRLDGADRRALLNEGFPVGDGPMAVRIIWPGEEFVIDSSSTTPGDRWVMAEIVSGFKWGYSEDGQRGLWLMTRDDEFFSANEFAFEVSTFSITDLRPTNRELEALTAEVTKTYPTDSFPGPP